MKLLGIIISFLFITGCASSANFDCPASRGIKCKSISVIDRMVTDGSIDNINMARNTHKNKDYTADKITFPQHTLSNAPTRTTEQVLQLWVAPYETVDGIYYQQAFLNVVVKNGGWVSPIVDDLTMVE